MRAKKAIKIISHEDRIKAIKTEEEKIRLFEVYMIEIWQWKRVWKELIQCWECKTRASIEDGYKAWLKKEKIQKN